MRTHQSRYVNTFGIGRNTFVALQTIVHGKFGISVFEKLLFLGRIFEIIGNRKILLQSCIVLRVALGTLDPGAKVQ